MAKEKQGNWFKRHKLLTGLAVIIVIIAIATSANNKGDQSTQKTATSDGNSSKTEQKTNDKPRLTLDEGWTLDKSNPYATQVVGTVSNNSDQAINGYIQVTFSALDADGANIGDCLANANTVDANGKWKFKALCSNGTSEVATVRFKDITGF